MNTNPYSSKMKNSLNFPKNLTSLKTYNNDDFISYISTHVENFPIVKTNKKIEYLNISSAFDIESTSTYLNGEKISFMYEWTLGIDGIITIGRTWETFISTITQISEVLQLNNKKRLIIYVQNLSFEFQFFRKLFGWEKVFSIDERKPIYAISTLGIEFRCSYILSGLSLELMGEGLRKYKVKKLIGNLDYSLIRHSQTPLTDDELAYCINDVKVVMAYIQEKIESDGDISKVPYTKTGYVRRYCKNACYYDNKSHKKGSDKFFKYRELMNELTLTPEEYKQCKRAFHGGFTHANPFYSNETLTNVHSFDFTSSYPAVMVSEMFPMSKGKLVKPKSVDEFKRYIRCYCCLFDIELTNVKPKIYDENPLSFSKGWGIQNAVLNNGRIASADSVKLSITEQDFIILNKFYEWDKMRIANFRIYKKGYLPTDLIKAILTLYKDKTELKGVEGKEELYSNSKEKINACFGMCVTDICRDEIIYDDTWSISDVDIDKAIERYNNSRNRFLSYLWGIWITAYAQKNLFTGIYEFKHDYIYSDTDSLKVFHVEHHKRYIEAYNDNVLKKLKKALAYHKIDESYIKPKTIEGVEKPLGVWDYEGEYSRFKTVGAKRYITEKNGKISITVSGVNKKNAVPYLIAKYGRDDVFNAFTQDLYIPSYNDIKTPIYDEHNILINNPTGKMTHTYIDDLKQGYVIDYKGVEDFVSELSSVHLENADYSMTLTDAYIDYLIGIKEIQK